jgi:hypothetical protein
MKIKKRKRLKYLLNLKIKKKSYKKQNFCFPIYSLLFKNKKKYFFFSLILLDFINETKIYFVFNKADNRHY